jgi:ABC-2 type transport system ATP-binding protein
MDYALEINNLNKYYHKGSKGEIRALDDINLYVPRGSFFALLGPNGAGKSTLINILAGIVNKSSGSLFIDNTNYDESPELARSKIGVMPQEVAIDTFFPVRESLEFFGGYYGLNSKQRKTDEILEAVGLSDKKNTITRSLSGGMKRRFMMAKALVHSPPVLILDEPTAGVDLNLRNQLWDYVSKLNRDGTTIILTTHYLEEAEKLCDRIAFINKGQIISNQPKSNLLNSLGDKELIIEFTETLPKELPQLSEFNYHVNDENKLVIKFSNENNMLSPLLEKVSNLGFTIKDLSTNQGDLEDIFISMMDGSW